MFVLSKIFGDCPQAKILEVFAEHIDEELSIPDIIWLTDMPKTTIYSYVRKLLDEKILIEGDKIGKTQLYNLNNDKEEVKIVLSLVNYIVSEKLAEKLEEKGLKQLEEHEINIAYSDRKVPYGYLIMKGKKYASEILDLFNIPEYKRTKAKTSLKYERGINIWVRKSKKNLKLNLK